MIYDRRTALQLMSVTAAAPFAPACSQLIPLRPVAPPSDVSGFLDIAKALADAALRRLEPHVGSPAGWAYRREGGEVLDIIGQTSFKRRFEHLSNNCIADEASFVAILCANAMGALKQGPASFKPVAGCSLGSVQVQLYRSGFSSLGLIADRAAASLHQIIIHSDSGRGAIAEASLRAHPTVSMKAYKPIANQNMIGLSSRR